MYNGSHSSLEEESCVSASELLRPSLSEVPDSVATSTTSIPDTGSIQVLGSIVAPPKGESWVVDGEKDPSYTWEDVKKTPKTIVFP